MFRPPIGRGPYRLAATVALVALVVGAMPGPLRAADPTTARGHDPARMQRIVAQLRSAERAPAHADGAGHVPGAAVLDPADLAYLGLRIGRGPCAGMYEVVSDDDRPVCSHGLDVDVPGRPGGTDAGTPAPSSSRSLASTCSYDIVTCPAPSGWKIPTQIPCYSSGPYVEVLYVYWGTGAYSSYKERIRRSVASIDLLFKISAGVVKSSTGTAGNRHVRWAMNSGCDLRITAVKLPNTVSDDISSIKSNLVHRGIITASRKYLAFVDNNACYGGIAEVAVSSTKSSTNPNNRGGSLGMVYDCFDTFDPYAGYGANIAAHELMHTLGAVEYDAPHTTKGHCWDDLAEAHTGADLMCYNDGGVPLSKFYQRCASTYPETFDCGKDDYYNPYPTSTSYLGTHWNAARNQFLATTEPTAWQQLPKPLVTFTKPAIAGGAIGGGTVATINGTGVAGIPIRTVAWTIGGVAVSSSAADPTTLGRSTFKTRTGGYANGTVLTIGAKVTDEGGLGGSGTTTATVWNPYVRIAAPAAFAETSGTVPWSVAAAATGGRTVAKVELLVDGVVKATDTTSPYGGTYLVPAFEPAGPWDIGSYAISARVTDSAGVVRSTPPRTLYMPHLSIAWTAPSLTTGGYDASFPLRVPYGQTVPLTINASSSVAGGIDHVVFRVNGVTVATDAAAPYAYDFVTPATTATSSVSAQAVDASGVAITSDTIYIKSMAASGALTASVAPDPVDVGADITFTGTATPPAGGIIDSLCLYVDAHFAPGCVYPAYVPGDDHVTVSASTFGVGDHVAFWHVTTNTKADYTGTWIERDTGYRRFTVTGAGGAPSIALTGITAGGRYSGKVSIFATVSGVPDPSSVQQVEFFEGGRSLGVDTVAGYNAFWTTATGADGDRVISAEATLLDGRRLRTSIPVVAVNAAASLTAPLAGAAVSGMTTLSGTGAYDADTALESAAFLVDGVAVGTDLVAPFSLSWDSTTVANGPHTVAMRLQLTDGRTKTTPATSISVGN